MNREVVSIIVPIYKVEQYLERCLTSLVTQSYQNLEIILVDDGSPDKCPEMCENWARLDRRIRVVHKENQGLGMARNTGIEYATGEYICYFDSDDYIAKNTIELAYNALKQNNADLAIFGNYRVFLDGSTSRFCAELRKTVYSGEEIINELLPWLIQSNRRKEPACPFAFSAWSGVLRRSVLEDYRILFQSEREIISEDTLYLLQLYSKLHTVVLLPKPLYYYCVNQSSLTKTYQKERQQKNNAFLLHAKEMVAQFGYGEEVWIRLNMLYHGFSLEAMKHIIRMPLPYRDKRKLLHSFFTDRDLNESITWETISRSGTCMAIFLLFLKWKLQLPVFVLLWLREKRG